MVSYYHQVYSHSHSLTHSPTHVIPVNTSMVSSYHQVYSHTVFSLTHSHIHHPCEHSHGVVLPPSHHTHTHSLTHSPIHVIPLTHCSERTCAPTHTSMVSYYHQVITHPHQSLCSHSLPSTMSSHTLLPSLHFTSFSPPTHPNSSPTLSHPSCLHRIIITSSPLPITNHHQSLPLTPHNTPNPSISLPTLPIVS